MLANGEVSGLQVRDKVSTHRRIDRRLQDAKRERRALTPGDLEFVRTFEGTEPSKVPAEDVRLLAQLEA